MSQVRKFLDQLAEPLHRRKLAAIEWLQEEAAERGISISEFVLGKEGASSERRNGKTPQQQRKIDQVMWLVDNHPESFYHEKDREFFADICAHPRLSERQEDKLDGLIARRERILKDSGI